VRVHWFFKKNIAKNWLFYAKPIDTDIHKDIYVYLAPQEPEISVNEIQATVAPHHINENIIVIKAPTYDQQIQQQIAAQAAIEEKTLVYVLVKKPDDISQTISASTPEFVPSKPEVYFIKYKNTHSAAGQPAATYGVPSAPLSDLSTNSLHLPSVSAAVQFWIIKINFMSIDYVFKQLSSDYCSDNKE
jgi:hypothetical protein